MIRFFTIFFKLMLGVLTVAAIAGYERKKTDSRLVRVFRNRHRFICALVCLLFPQLLGRAMFWMLYPGKMPPFASLGFVNIFGTFSPLLDGILYGLAGCFIAAKQARGLIDRRQAMVMVVIFGFLDSLFLFFAFFSSRHTPPGTGFSPQLNPIVELIIAGLVLWIVSLRQKRFVPEMPLVPADPVKSQSPMKALIIGFLPAAMVLLFIPLVGGLIKQNKELTMIFMVIGCVVSVVCCFISAFMLFGRGTALAIVGGILLFLLNGVISFCFGCGAVLSQA